MQQQSELDDLGDDNIKLSTVKLLHRQRRSIILMASPQSARFRHLGCRPHGQSISDGIDLAALPLA